MRLAITGKGGVGKTTLAAALVRRLVERGGRPVLAVDADPNSCLDSALGVTVQESLGRIREEARVLAGQGMGAGISKHDLLELKASQCLVEADGFDLIAMGRCEGPGCYCFANNVLKQVLGRIATQYRSVVIDNEAGLENLSRRIVQEVDVLLMVGDGSARGLETIRRLAGVAQEMGIKAGRRVVVVNRLRDPQPRPGLEALQHEVGAHQLVTIADDPQVAQAAETSQNVFSLPPSATVLAGAEAILKAMPA